MPNQSSSNSPGVKENVLPESKVLEVLILCSEKEFLGQGNGVEDQIIWRRRAKNEKDGVSGIFIHSLNPVTGKRSWASGSLVTLDQHWDGKVFLASNGGAFSNPDLTTLSAVLENGETKNKSEVEPLAKSLAFFRAFHELARHVQKIRLSSGRELIFTKDAGGGLDCNSTLLKYAQHRQVIVQGDDGEARSLVEKLPPCPDVLPMFPDGEGPIQVVAVRELLRDLESGLKRNLGEFNSLIRARYGKLKLLVPSVARSGRGVICSSFEGDFASIVVRGDLPGGIPRPSMGAVQMNWRDDSAWRASEKRDNTRPFAIKDYVDVIYQTVIKDVAKCTGLIVVMAETSSGKSKIVYGLMHEYLAKRIAPDQFIHALTLEDPIEQLAYDKKTAAKRKAPPSSLPKYGYPTIAAFSDDYYVHYTARHKGLDCDLHGGLQDALRQKPAIVCVGEIREEAHWKAVMDFAGTGHLVVATAHADKLSTAMGKILRACDAKTPAQRGDEARRILAMVHLERVVIEPSVPWGKALPEAILMTIWRRENGGADSLVSAGRDSIAPHWGKEKGIIGSQFICNQLLLKHRDRPALDIPESFAADLMNRALKHDCSGI